MSSLPPDPELRLKPFLLGYFGSMLVLTGLWGGVMVFVMTPRAHGLPFANAELGKLLDDNLNSMNEVRMLMREGKVEEASRLVARLGFLSLSLDKEDGDGGQGTISILVYEQIDCTGGYTIHLDHPSGKAEARYRSMTPEYGTYSPCVGGWWVVRH